jgi:hypothetical protein
LEVVMRRSVAVTLASVLAGLAVVTVLNFTPARTGAQAGTPSAAGQGFVGAWRLTTETPFGASQSLLTLMADGTVLFSDRPVLPGGAGFPDTFVSTGHGAWEQTGPERAAATFVFFITDGEGNFLGVVTDSVEAALEPGGASWSGPFSSTTTDPAGKVLYIGNGMAEATRITVQPLATPVATPSA